MKAPVFAAPWHAQVFALTVHLNDTGRLAWPDWAARFGAVLAAHGVDRDLDGGDDYFNAWVAALEGFLRDEGIAGPVEVEAMRAAWEAAYLTTPHGQPVQLSTSSTDA